MLAPNRIELGESSRHLTTFKTHVGLRHYKRLPYGASVGSEICQHVIGKVLEGCHNVRNIADDILVHGTTKEEHDRSLENVLLRLQGKNLTVNPAKCLFGVPELNYYGFHISAQGHMRGTRTSLKLKSISDNESGGLALIFKQRDMCANALVAKSLAQLLLQSLSERQIHQSKCGTQSTLTTVAHSHQESIPLFLLQLMKRQSIPEVHVTHSGSAATAITHLNQMFATHGIPEVITSDNVPFGLEEFKALRKQLGITHRIITPLWPAAKAQVEGFNKTLEKTIRIATVEGKNWRSELFVFLMNYRTTPHSSTGVSPASLMMNRHIRTKIPCLNLPRTSNLVHIACANDNLRKSKAKAYMDKRHSGTTSDIRQGDQVLLLQKRQNKLTLDLLLSFKKRESASNLQEDRHDCLGTSVVHGQKSYSLVEGELNPLKDFLK
ncbi:Uncharacterized protein K02A2.6 [Stylophora pistillata]|uniref:Uncharacterized protein K02A2.6 n=1 Tax=Stylophora pistillata TaxID=50429 RepID=A0A2B4SQ45_STYPI|nr:Uncharacterized protein K02A2.6 [Stylophora pistillata]